MKSFRGKLAVVTGGGSGMGRELVRQLAAEGCSVATCDVRLEAVRDTARVAGEEAPEGTRVTGHACDVADEASVLAFRDEVLAEHDTDHVDLVFNNAGLGGGQSFVTGAREEWDHTFAVCWGGVYHGTRAFLPLLIAAEEGHLINTASVNGFWARLGPGQPNTAYSTAKFAVKGFTESLLEDLRLHAPHVRASVVMPGHIGTDIVKNALEIHGATRDLDAVRTAMTERGFPADGLDDDAVRSLLLSFGDTFRESAPMTAAEAATVILDGVRADRWRILVGADAHALDEAVRADPEEAYGPDLDLTTILATVPEAAAGEAAGGQG